MAAVSFSDLIWPIDSLYLHKRGSAPYDFDPANCFGGTWVYEGTTTIKGVIYDAWYRSG